MIKKYEFVEGLLFLNIFFKWIFKFILFFIIWMNYFISNIKIRKVLKLKVIKEDLEGGKIKKEFLLLCCNLKNKIFVILLIVL